MHWLYLFTYFPRPTKTSVINAIIQMRSGIIALITEVFVGLGKLINIYYECKRIHFYQSCSLNVLYRFWVDIFQSNQEQMCCSNNAHLKSVTHLNFASCILLIVKSYHVKILRCYFFSNPWIYYLLTFVMMNSSLIMTPINRSIHNG